MLILDISLTLWPLISFACKWLGVGTNQFDLFYSYRNALQNCQVGCHIYIYLGCIQKLPKIFWFFVCQILKTNYKTPSSFKQIFRKTSKTSQQQTKFRHGEINMNHPKSFKKCLVTYKILQNFPASQLGRWFKHHYILHMNTLASLGDNYLASIITSDTLSWILLIRITSNIDCLKEPSELFPP